MTVPDRNIKTLVIRHLALIENHAVFPQQKAIKKAFCQQWWIVWKVTLLVKTVVVFSICLLLQGCESTLTLAEVVSHAKDCPHKPPADLDPKVSNQIFSRIAPVVCQNQSHWFWFHSWLIHPLLWWRTSLTCWAGGYTPVPSQWLSGCPVCRGSLDANASPDPDPALSSCRRSRKPSGIRQTLNLQATSKLRQSILQRWGCCLNSVILFLIIIIIIIFKHDHLYAESRFKCHCATLKCQVTLSSCLR